MDNPDKTTITPTNQSEDNSAPAASSSSNESAFTPNQSANSGPSHGLAPKGNRRLLKWLMLLVAVGVVAALAFWFMKNHNDNPKVATTATIKPIPLLRLGTDENFTDTFYPDPDSLDGGGGNAIQENIYEGLVGWGPNNKLVPLLASSWTNPDSKTWVFKLNPNVKFHDGNKMTAQDVKTSLESSDAPGPSGFGLPDVVDQITVVDSSTIKITTKAPDALLLDRLANAYIYDPANSHKNDTLNGTGPYTLKPGTTANADQIDLVAFKDYYGAKPTVHEIVGKNYSDSGELAKAIKAGQVDLAFQVTTADKQDILKSTNQFKFDTVSAAGTHSVQPDTLKPGSPVQKLQVRQALQSGLNASAILKASGSDGELIGQLGPQTMTGYDPTLKPAKYDPDAAKKLLTEAGYPNGVTLSIFHGPPSSPAVKEMVSELKQIGITLDDHTATSFSAFHDALDHHVYDLYFSGDNSDFADLEDLANANFVKGGDFQTYENPQVDSLLAESNGQFDATTRIKTLQQIQEKLATDAAYVPIYVDTFQVAIRSNYVVPFTTPHAVFGTYIAKIYQQ